MSENPYSPPQVVDIPVPLLSDAEVIRKEHLGTEASIKSIGLLYWLGAAFLAVAGFGLSAEKETAYGPALVAVFAALAILYGFMGFAIRRFKPWSRWVAVILTVPGLFKFPVGTLISGYIIYLLLGRKGTMVFSASYQEIIAATPHIKYKTSKWVWIALGALLMIFGLIAVLAAMSDG